MKTGLPNYLRPGLAVLFIGINPGLRSAAIGHHFAGHSNRFWKFLFESGLTPDKLTAQQDIMLLQYGYGITNIVPRPTATAAELRPDEFREGAVALRQLIAEYHPRVAAYAGKIIYQYLSGKKELAWGQQPESIIPGVIDYLLPNPSGLNRMPAAVQLEYFCELKRLIS